MDEIDYIDEYGTEWKYEANSRKGTFSLERVDQNPKTGEEIKKSVFLQGEPAEIFIEQLEKVDFAEFLDWFYDMGYGRILTGKHFKYISDENIIVPNTD